VRLPKPTPRAGGIATVDASGVVVEYKRSELSERRKLETMLWRRMAEAGLPEPVKEYRFAESIGRQWRFDGAWPDLKVAVEVEGGIWAPEPGRHNRGSGMEEDCRKYNAAALLGWNVIRVTERIIKSGEACETLRKALTPASQKAQQLCLTR
jgi:hypothetical protein